MIYKVYISGVDQETFMSAVRHDPEEALAFLQRYDHEGSSIDFSLEAENPDEVYQILRMLAEGEK